MRCKNNSISLIFQLTNKCNQKCFFCPTTIKKEKNSVNIKAKDYEKFILLISKIKNIKEISLIGEGETFLYNDISKMLEIMGNYKNAMRVIVTNGTLIDKHLKSISKNIDRVHISIHGLKKTHNKITKTLSFDCIEKNISKLRIINPNLEILINSVPCKENYLELLFLIKYLKKHNLNGHCFMHQQHTSLSNPVLDFSEEKVDDLFEIIEKSKNYSDNIYNIPDLTKNQFKNIYYNNFGSYDELTCSAIIDDELVLTAEGEITFGCINIGNIFDNEEKIIYILSNLDNQKKLLIQKIKNKTISFNCAKCCDATYLNKNTKITKGEDLL